MSFFPSGEISGVDDDVSDSSTRSSSSGGWGNHHWARSFSERVRRLHDSRGHQEGASRSKLLQ
ncbi:hypothetical protein Bpfe_009908, partial [Biomphalaria pfeifferi]